MNPNLYEVLGVKETATPHEIKRAYRDLAKRYHPDRHGGDKAKESKFKDVSAAYDVLSDPEKRKKYDAMRHGGFREMGQGTGDINIEDLLGQMFGGRFAGAQAAGRTRRRGAGPQVIFETYGDFDGGFDPFSRQREPVRPSAPAEKLVRTPDGYELVQRGDDLYTDAQVSIEEAVVGGKVTVPTLEGLVTVTVPPGTSSGRKLRLRGRGAASSSGRGDQYVVVQILVPTKVDDKARELLREFTRRAPVEVHVPGRGKKAGAR